MRATKALVLVFLALVAGHCLAKPIEEEENEDVTDFTNAILEWARTGYQTETLNAIIQRLALPAGLQKTDWRRFRGARAGGICTVCKSMVKSVLTMRAEGTPVEIIQEIISNLCIQLNLQTENVCQGVVKLNTPIIFYIVEADPSITPSDVCGVALQDKNCSTTSDKFEWTIEIEKNPVAKNVARATEETVKILQISDIHYDPLYEPNGNSQCQEPTCCRKGQNATSDGNSTLAGYWGDYNDCDSPWHAVVDALTQMKDGQHQMTYIYFTGDIIDHGVWETTRRGNIESLLKSYAEIKNTFSDTPVYPILGNHEPHPLNQFAPDYIEDDSLSTRWLYELLSDLWINYGWLPESTRETILKGGFYTVSPRKGFRIIVLNNNVCYTYNWWLILDPKDPSGQLRWLADTLAEAELNEEYVHILAHIPPGSETCYVTWSREFRRIVLRYAHIITAQFNGHTHFDELNVFYNDDDSVEAVNVAWNGGSVTPYTNLNPNYKVYTANAGTFAIEQVDTWIYNLTAANKSPEKRPEWYKSYSFKEEYGLDDLSLPSLHRWIVNMTADTTMLEKYRKNFHKYADPALSKKCDSQCMKSYLCNLVKTSAEDETNCEDIIEM